VPFSLTTPCNWLQVYENTQDPIHTVFLHTRMTGAQFGEAWSEMQVIDYRATPIGMINVQTRRWGDLAWNRTTEIILPNGNQTGAIWEQVEGEKFFRRVAITRWMVPVDDTTTRTIGQLPDRPYEEVQRVPGDYEAQVSQRPIAVHALEHLGSTDRGVVMLRNQIRRGIRSVADGSHENPLRTDDGGPIPTYCQDTIFTIPANSRLNDRDLLADFGRSIADELFSNAALKHDARERSLRDMCQNLYDKC
jgi:hypothetical protein